MTEVVKAFEWIDGHFALPVYDLIGRPEINWRPASYEWLRLPWYDPAWECLEIEVYYDGSSIPGPDGSTTAGAAAALFLRTPQGWTLGGAFSHRLQTRTTSYLAELWASVLATKAVHDVMKLIQASHG